MPQIAIGRRDRHPRPQQQCPMKAEGRHRVGGLEAPAGKQGLHDLEPMRDPSDAIEKRARVHAGSGARLMPKAISGSMRGSTTCER